MRDCFEPIDAVRRHSYVSGECESAARRVVEVYTRQAVIKEFNHCAKEISKDLRGFISAKDGQPSAVATSASRPIQSPIRVPLDRKSLTELNAEHPLGDAFFDYDQTTLRDDAQRGCSKMPNGSPGGQGRRSWSKAIAMSVDRPNTTWRSAISGRNK